METRAKPPRPVPDTDWNSPHMLLDTREIYQEFMNTVSTLPLKDDMDWNLVLGESLEYLMDYDTAHGNILEYVYEIRNQVSKWYDEEIVRRLGEALRDFVVQVFEHLQELKAYEDGSFNWAFQEFVGGDMRVYRIE